MVDSVFLCAVNALIEDLFQRPTSNVASACTARQSEQINVYFLYNWIIGCQ